MKENFLVNEYGLIFGVEYVFDTLSEMRAFEKERYGEEGFPSDDNWNLQIRFKVLEKEDPESLAASLRRQGYSSEEIRAMGINCHDE